MNAPFAHRTAAEQLDHYERKYGAENRYSTALAVVRALPLTIRLRLLTEVTQDEDFADFCLTDVRSLDLALDHMLAASIEADKAASPVSGPDPAIRLDAWREGRS